MCGYLVGVATSAVSSVLAGTPPGAESPRTVARWRRKASPVRHLVMMSAQLSCEGMWDVVFTYVSVIM